MEIEIRSFALPEPKEAVHPTTGKPITIVGIHTSTEPPTMIALVTGVDGKRVERLERVRNRVP